MSPRSTTIGILLGFCLAGTLALAARLSLAMAPVPSPSGPRWWHILELTRLAPASRELISILLVLPLGALITAVFRNVIGVATFGTFAPVLLALSFIHADWRTGVVLLSLVVTGGILSRLLLERARLARVPRLGILLSIVVLGMVLFVSALDGLEVASGTRTLLLPVVIVTMLVERLYVSSEQDGIRTALHLAAGTVLVAGLCLLLLRWRPVGELLVAYPELHFFTMGLLAGVGRYSGYRLTELWRFRDAVAPVEPEDAP